MTASQQKKINELVEKYNDILMVSMRLAVSEDFVNLVILNKDDSDFELSDLLKNKEEFSNHVMKEFLKQNSSPVIKELKNMNERKVQFNKSTDKA